VSACITKQRQCPTIYIGNSELVHASHPAPARCFCSICKFVSATVNITGQKNFWPKTYSTYVLLPHLQQWVQCKPQHNGP
jgi:hypothetical protein